MSNQSKDRRAGRINAVSKGAGWLGLVTGLTSLMVYEADPALGLYSTIGLAVALVLLVFFFFVHFEALKSLSTKRSTRLGLNSILMVVIFVSILGILNFLSNRHHIRFDFSETGRFTLAPQTLQVLKGLEQDVEILAFVSEQSPTRAGIKDLLDNYSYYTPRISHTFIDPDKKPSISKQYGITQYDTLVFESGKQETQIKTVSEQEVTNALIRVSKEIQQRILFLEDHGEHSPADTERSGFSRVRISLQKQGFEVGALSLLEEGRVPENTAVLVIAGPQKDFLPLEKAALSDYLSEKGKVLMLLNPDTPVNLNDLLSQWGIRMVKGLVVDSLSRLLGGDFTIPVVSNYPPHEITENFNLATFFPVSQAIDFDQTRAVEYDFKPLAVTSDNSWSKTNPNRGNLNFDPAEDVRGPLTLAALVTRKARLEGSGDPEHSAIRPGPAPDPGQPMLAIFGDSDFATNASFAFSGNGDLFLNTVIWLAQEKNLVSIRPKEPQFTPLFLTRAQGKVLMYISILLLPAAIMITGWVISRRRRRL